MPFQIRSALYRGHEVAIRRRTPPPSWPAKAGHPCLSSRAPGETVDGQPSPTVTVPAASTSRRFGPLVLLSVGATLLLALAGTMANARAADVAAGQQVFRQQCAICHADKPGVNKIGPPLFGVVGRKTGAVPGYNYSVANKNSNITWTPEELDKYLNAPQSVIPGTKMPYGGLQNATKRQNLIGFLETLK